MSTSAELVPERPSLVAVASLPLVPAHSRYAQRVSALLRQLAEEWRITLLAPDAAAVADDLFALGIDRLVPIPAMTDWDDWTLDGGGVRRLLADAVDQAAPKAAIVWAGAEPIVLGERFPFPVLVDRLDSELLITLRALRLKVSVKNRLRLIRDAAVWVRRERRIARAFPAVIVSSDADARMLRAVSGMKNVHVVQNGVTVDGTPDVIHEASVPTVAFSGSLQASSETNVRAVRWFVDAVWPSVRQAVPHTRFVIAGRNPSREILRLHGVPGIEIVPNAANMTDILRQAWVAVAPLQSGAGVPTKILEAWAVGRPVVLSPIAATGVRMDADAASLVARNAREMARTTIRLLTNHDERHRLGRAAFSLATREYSGWRRAGAAIQEILHASVAAFETDGGRLQPPATGRRASRKPSGEFSGTTSYAPTERAP